MKTYVEITAQHDKSGNIHPLIMHWLDGRQWMVDKILDVQQAPSMIGGGHGMRYICRICNKQVYLFCDEGRWFIEQ